MDQQNQNLSGAEPTAPRHVPTAEEIARAEAEAVAAMQRGEAPAKAAAPQADGAPEAPAQKAAPSDFVPYVDDVPEPEIAPDADDEDDGEYIPSEWEKRIDALSPERWKLYQIIGGAAVGIAAIAALFLTGEELSTYGLIVAALLALLLPRYLERAWRRKLTVAKRAMLIAMVIGLAVMFVVVGLRTGFTLRGGN